MYKTPEEGCNENRARLFPEVPSASTRGHGHKLEHRRFPLNSRQHFCAVQVTEHWHRLPRGCGVSSSEVSRSLLAVGLGTLLWVALLQWGWDWGTQRALPASGMLGFCRP